MTNDHEAIDELLAGYVLRSLSGEDAAEADHLLSDHVPTCAACRDTLAAFQDLSADLALDAVPLAPPETLLPRLQRELEPPASREWRKPRRPSPATPVGNTWLPSNESAYSVVVSGSPNSASFI